ncbi:MAG: FtsQ-type POTRA domain-containing protein [Gemmatimonadota bacterium]|nr:MAG: FtsQ-type POTRA domain-containing protein [Gemmatimonadota bacterium]
MKGRSALPRMAFLAGLLVVAGGIVGSIWGGRLLAQFDYFDVRRVEVVGARWLAPDSALRLAAIGPERSVWDDYSDVERRLVRHPLIEEAQVRRSGVHALRIVVREVEPIALVGVPELRPVLGDGTLLPIDPAGSSLDLPLLTMNAAATADSTRLRGGAALRALEIFAKLQNVDPGLAEVISDFQLLDGRGLMTNLVMSQPARRLALPAEVDESLARRVRATLADLRNRGVEAALVEARYADLIVVRREQL